MHEKKVIPASTLGVEINSGFNDYRHWYAVQTTAGYEKKFVSNIRLLSEKEIELYYPARKVIHQLRGSQCIRELPLFPGYIFVHNNIVELLAILDKSKSRIMAKPVMANGKYLEVSQNEMEFLFSITGKEGIIELSKGIAMGDEEVQIINGPLKHFKGRILFINKRKNKAKARFEIMNRMVDVSLGLEIISRSAMTSAQNTSV